MKKRWLIVTLAVSAFLLSGCAPRPAEPGPYDGVSIDPHLVDYDPIRYK